jgi:hypothetical protein
MTEKRIPVLVTCSPEIMPLVSWLVGWRRTMRRGRFTEDQIVGVPRDLDSRDLCRLLLAGAQSAQAGPANSAYFEELRARVLKTAGSGGSRG